MEVDFCRLVGKENAINFYNDPWILALPHYRVNIEKSWDEIIKVANLMDSSNTRKRKFHDDLFGNPVIFGLNILLDFHIEMFIRA